jgi:hypothetical protein
MDTLGLNWAIRYRDKKKKHPIRCLSIEINGVPLTDIIATYEADHQLTPISDSYIADYDLEKAGVRFQWISSTKEDSYIMLLGCSCGQLECSHLGVNSITRENWVYWRFDISQAHLQKYADLPEFWFDKGEYRKQVSSFCAD